MSRHLRRLVAACLLAVVAGGLTAPAQAGSPHAAADLTKDPLSVTIDSLSPSTLTSPSERGRITMKGEVRNDSEEPWTELIAYVVPGAAPIRSPDELAAALASDPLTPYGNRLVEPGMYVRLPNLDPGQTAPYRLSVPIRALGLAAGQGVYWIGVHILGTSSAGRFDVADGRARTLLPVMSSSSPRASVDIVVPFRQKVARASDGRVLNTAAWSRLLGPTGRLTDLLNFVAASPISLSLLVDPAVVDAAQSLAVGNPTSSGKATAAPDPAAEDWARSFRLRARLSDLLTLPYGDTDAMAALTERHTRLLGTAESLSESSFSQATLTPVIAPASGYLSPSALKTLGPGHTVLLDTGAVPNADAPALHTTAGPTIVSGDPLLATHDFSAASLASLRQLLLARLAVSSLAGTGKVPVVLLLPANWDPGFNGAEFFQGFAVPWVRTVSLAKVRRAASPHVFDSSTIDVPDGTDTNLIPAANFSAAAALMDQGTTLASLLGDPTVGTTLSKQALLSVSEHARAKAASSRRRLDRATTSVLSRLGKVTLSGPDFVTMSSETGTFQVTISNALDQDVTVGIVGNSGTRLLRIKAPSQVTVPAGQRRSIRVTATSKRLGVFLVTIHAVTVDGHDLPREIAVSVRSSQVGQVLWVVFGAAGLILLVAIVLRIIRRIRGRTRERH